MPMTLDLTSPSLSNPVACFSMEIGLHPKIPTYAGGLGMLAGDLLRAAADDGTPMVGVSLLHRNGYFRQHLDEHGNQTESPEEWSPPDRLVEMPARAAVSLEGRVVTMRAWRYVIQGIRGHSVPVYLLDTSLPENDAWDRTLTDVLYGGDSRYRLCQEAVLGLGGVAMLEALGHVAPQCFHMNEGHSALLSLALLETQTRGRDAGSITMDDVQRVRRRCVFTTHTPVPSGHDHFPEELVQGVLGAKRSRLLDHLRCCVDGHLNMTYLALFFSHFINGVSMRHEEISKSMFPSYPINAITNGVHAVTWTSPPFRRLFDLHVPEWRHDNRYLRYAISIAPDKILQTHTQAKRDLLALIMERTEIVLDPKVMTLGFARRAARYKRTGLLFADLDRLRRIARDVGPLQIVLGGKAHPRDEGGKALLREIHEAAAALDDAIRIVYLENYDMTLGLPLSAGVDLWINTPQKPFEASGTSGMKAALNGVPSLSILDGWWIEGHIEGVTGWSIDDAWQTESDSAQESERLYDKLEYLIVPMYYGRPTAYAKVMRSAIALNGSFFNAQRMLDQYVQNAYLAAVES